MAHIEMNKDTYFFQSFHETRGPSRVTINEHRAPTDDSIRIYQEMLEKAEKNIYKLFRVDDNSLNCTLLKNMCDYELCAPTIVCLIKLNGHMIKVKQEISADQHETIQSLIEKMGREIAIHMIQPVLNEFTRTVDTPGNL